MGSISWGNSSIFVLDTISKALQLASVGFNGAIIYTIWRKSLMRITSSRLVFSLCLSHLLVSFISLVISIATFFLPSEIGLISTTIMQLDSDGQPTDKVLCMENSSAILSHVLLYMTFGVAISTLITVTLISIERYITIARPMKYKSIVTPRRCFVAITLCWILSALLVFFPIVFFNNKTKQCGSILVPTHSLCWYFAAVFTILTILGITVMIVCYSHIFSIAKEKCQKVQIGQFSASAPASISSDWASSVHSSIQGQQNNRGWFYSGSRMTSSNSLLHWVLMANLRHHNANPLRDLNVPQSPELSPTNSIKSEPNSTVKGFAFPKDPRLSRAKQKWRKYLQQNYNSPRKTVCTILCLIGSVIITQLPMSFVLFTQLERNPVLFYFCHDLLFALSSVTNPILYGFLNRNIRDQLWKIFRPQTLRRNRQKRANSMSNHSVLGELKDIFTPKTERIIIQSRKGSLTSEDSNSSGVCTVSGKMSNPVPNLVPNPAPNPYLLKRKDTVAGLDELSRFKLRKINLVTKCSGNDSNIYLSNQPKQEEVATAEKLVQDVDYFRQFVQAHQREGVEEVGLEDEILQNLEFPRKPSQDSGADMTFSDEDQEDHDHNHEQEASSGKINGNYDSNNKKEDSRSLRSVRNVENYLRIYENFLDRRNSVKSKSDSDIINAGRQENSLQLQSEHQPQIVIKSQCQLGQEMLLLRHLQLADDLILKKPSPLTLTSIESLSSSRQKLLQRLQANSCCNSADLLRQCSCSINLYNYQLEEGGGGGDNNGHERFICKDLIKIGNVFNSDFSDSSDDSNSNCSAIEESDDEEGVKVQIAI